MTDLASFFFLAETTAMVIASLLLVYPVVAYARNVAYTRGLLLLAASFLIVTASYIVWGVLQMSLLSTVLDLVASIAAAAGVWQFARPHIRFDDQPLETQSTTETTGGFDSAGDD